MGYGRAVVLNESEPAAAKLEQPLDIALTLAMADMKAQFMDPESGRVDYRAIGRSEAFDRYKDLASRLRSFDLRTLEGRDQRLAFWINIYNTAVIHGVIELGLDRSVKQVPRFFHRIVYDIGGYGFSLSEMEHGILRGNRRPPNGLRHPFGGMDPRLEFAVIPMDPRVHFSLVCGARSCPPIGFYEAERLDFQLQLAAASFINSSNVEILPQETTVSISRIFKWYKADFGGTKATLVDTILNDLDEGENKAFLRENRDRIRIRYQPYDWRLNE